MKKWFNMKNIFSETVTRVFPRPVVNAVMIAAGGGVDNSTNVARNVFKISPIQQATTKKVVLPLPSRSVATTGFKFPSPHDVGFHKVFKHLRPLVNPLVETFPQVYSHVVIPCYCGTDSILFSPRITRQTVVLFDHILSRR